MKKGRFLIISELKDLESQVAKGEISYSRMVEILNEMADEYYKNKNRKPGSLHINT